MDLYAENILDHFQNPRNHGRLAAPSITVDDANPLCGDKLILDLIVENAHIKEIGFDGSGCAISQAAMSILTEEILHKSLTDAENFSKDELYKLLGVAISPARVKCALLGYTLLKKAIILLKHQES